MWAILSGMVALTIANINMVQAICVEDNKFMIAVVGFHTGFPREMTQLHAKIYIGNGGGFKVSAIPFLYDNE